MKEKNIEIGDLIIINHKSYTVLNIREICNTYLDVDHLYFKRICI